MSIVIIIIGEKVSLLEVCESTSQANHPSKRFKGTIGISETVASTLDRTNISDRKASLVLLSFSKQVGVDICELSLSPSAIRAQRIKHRKALAEEIKSSFSVKVPLLLHWDGKILPDLSGHIKIERLPILISGEKCTKLLAVPKLLNSKAETVACVIMETVEKWNLRDQVKGFCFDTTAVNTGERAGVCTILEKRLNKDVLHFACRHHIHELILEKAFTSITGEVSKGPDITIFTSFRENWSNVEHKEYRTAVTNEEMIPKIIEWKDDIISFAENALQEQHPRADYRELLELVIIFLGAKPPNGVRFRAPGPVHRAPWMARALYTLKMWMFRDQLPFAPKSTTRNSFYATEPFWQNLNEINIFICKVYVKAWIQSPVPHFAL